MKGKKRNTDLPNNLQLFKCYKYFSFVLQFCFPLEYLYETTKNRNETQTTQCFSFSLVNKDHIHHFMYHASRT